MRACWPFLGRTVLLLLLLPLLPFVLGEAVCQRNDTDLPDLKSASVLSRRRRLAFPKGSTFVVTMSVLQAIQLKLPSNWNLDFEFDLIWPIPSQEDLEKKFFNRRPSRLKRRHRRELYANFESALNSRDLPGRQCLLRTVCEAKNFLSPPGVSLIEDAIRLVLSIQLLKLELKVKGMGNVMGQLMLKSLIIWTSTMSLSDSVKIAILLTLALFLFYNFYYLVCTLVLKV